MKWTHKKHILNKTKNEKTEKKWNIIKPKLEKPTKNMKTEIKNMKPKIPPKKLDTTVAPPIISTDPELFWKNLTL